MQEREYVSDQEAYEVFAGQITPQEFVKGYEDFESPVDEAVKDFLRSFPYEEPIPSWLEDALCRYVESKLEELAPKADTTIRLKARKVETLRFQDGKEFLVPVLEGPNDMVFM